MSYLLAAVLATAVLIWLGSPLLTSPRAQAPDRPGRLEDLEGELEELYQAIRQLRLDFDAGKVGPTDYETVREEYETRAARVLAEINRLEG